MVYNIGYPYRNNTLPTSNVTFKSSNYPNIKSSNNISSDTLCISSKPHNNSKGKTIAVVTASILAIAGICFGAKKYSNLKNLKKEFDIAFGKDFSLMETNKLAKKYKEILKISDTKQYEVKLRKELVNDFGYKDLPIEFVEGKNRYATRMDLQNGKYLIDVRKDSSKQDMFSAYAHELRHIKQDEISYRAGREHFLEGYEPRAIDNLKRNNPNATDETINDFIQGKINPFFDKVWGKYPKINSGTKEYELAQRFNAAHKDYFTQTERALNANDKNMYRLNFLEDDAINVEETMGRLYKLLNN